MLKKYDLKDVRYHENMVTLSKAACYGLMSHEDVYWYETEAWREDVEDQAKLFHNVVEYLELRQKEGLTKYNLQKLVEVALDNPKAFKNPSLLNNVQFDIV